MTRDELWKTALAEIELTTSRASFITWFRNTAIVSYKEGGVLIGVPNGFSKEWLENKFNKPILKALRATSPDIKEIKFIIHNKRTASQKQGRVTRKKIPSLTSDQLSFEEIEIDRETNLNPRYTFENYIVGSSNELAHAAAYSVAQKPGKEYNPLFLYGGVGLGKTHLLHAIGNAIKEQKGKRKIQYLSCEKFTNEFIAALQAQRVKDFREKVRKVDVLIIDDIQFIANKERTQEEFFHTFNTLHEDNKQIILSSDRPPKALEFLEERLRSRFEGGMIADIGYPEFEVRVAILKAKTHTRGVTLPDTVLHYIADNIHNNIRELEGALNILLASSRVSQSDITLARAKKYLDHIIKRPRKVINVKKVIKAVADLYDISEKDILSQNRKREVSHPRQILMYFLREELKHSYPLIGTKLGGRDHTTVIHACHKISDALKKNDETIIDELNLLKQTIYNS